MADLRGLSALQLEILLGADPASRMRWEPRAWTRREQASWSRSLRRLEDRGLVRRLGRDGAAGCGRTHYIELTEAGREVWRMYNGTTGSPDRNVGARRAVFFEIPNGCPPKGHPCGP